MCTCVDHSRCPATFPGSLKKGAGLFYLPHPILAALLCPWNEIAGTESNIPCCVLMRIAHRTMTTSLFQSSLLLLKQLKIKFSVYIRFICTHLILKWFCVWLLTLVYFPGVIHGQRNLMGYSPWCRKELHTTEWMNKHPEENQVTVPRFVCLSLKWS